MIFTEDALPRRVFAMTLTWLAHDLAGYWTAENEIVVFKADGKGWLELVDHGHP